jgi:hypothetical protein
VVFFDFFANLGCSLLRLLRSAVRLLLPVQG